MNAKTNEMEGKESIENKYLDDECPVYRFMNSGLNLPIKLLEDIKNKDFSQ